MADYHVQVSEQGLKVWRTVRVHGGGRVRVGGPPEELASKAELSPDMKVFGFDRELRVKVGESNDRTGG